MSESKEPDSKKPLTINRPGRLELKKTIDAGMVKQSFSHGRTKSVAVEVKKKRTFTRGAEKGEMTEAQQAEANPFAPSADASKHDPHHGLSEAERQARLRALEGAAAARHTESHEHEEAEAAPAPAPTIATPPAPAAPPPAAEAKPVEARAPIPAEREAPAPAPAAPPAAEAKPAAPAKPAEPAPRPAAAEPAAPKRQKSDAEVRAEAEAAERDKAVSAESARRDEAARKLAAAQVGGRLIVKSVDRVPPPTTIAPRTREDEEKPAEGEDEDGEARRARGRAEVKKKVPAAPKGGEPRRRAGKLTINQAMDEAEGLERIRSQAAAKRARERERKRAHADQQPQEHRKVSREVVLPESITVQELANRMAEKGADVVKSLFKMGVMATITQSIDADTAELVAADMGHRVRRVSEADVEIGVEGESDAPETLKPRPPVVTIMGHVDHGKTSLLDALRKTDVAAHEAGGITQHIGAYQVNMPSGAKITFLDTPGHAAFTAMRARGAKVTDIVVLVVAADDGVQPQTIEAISHAKAAQVPLIVAVNKVDKPGVDPNRVRQALLQHEIVVEELGGETQAIDVSALKGTNLDKLEEAILLQAEILELKANPDREAQGAIVEAKLDRGRGPLATALVQRGTLSVGDIVVAGTEWGRVRALMNERGEMLKTAGPSTPVEILGLQGVPSAGDAFSVVADEARAREITEYRRSEVRKKAAAVSRGTIEQMFSRISEGAVRELPVVVKADVQGSVEAIVQVLSGLGTDKVQVRVLHTGVGGINESDIVLAKASGALVFGFNVRANQQARDAAQRDGIDIRYYSIIYDIADDVRKLLEGLLAPVKRENFLGYAQILEVFKITKVGNVAGCKVTEGVVKRGAGVRLLRDNVVIHTGKLSTLKRFKDEVREVKSGFECGMAFENYHDIKQGDMIECFEVEEVAATLEPARV